jgi:hypothetical protein
MDVVSSKSVKAVDDELRRPPERHAILHGLHRALRKPASVQLRMAPDFSFMRYVQP